MADFAIKACRKGVIQTSIIGGWSSESWYIGVSQDGFSPSWGHVSDKMMIKWIEGYSNQQQYGDVAGSSHPQSPISGAFSPGLQCHESLWSVKFGKALSFCVAPLLQGFLAAELHKRLGIGNPETQSCLVSSPRHTWRQLSNKQDLAQGSNPGWVLCLHAILLLQWRGVLEVWDTPVISSRSIPQWIDFVGKIHREP